MRITLFGIFITISLRVFAWSPADTWFPSSAELDALNTYLDENIEGIDSSTSYYARDFFQGGVWTYYYPHRIEKEAGVAWRVYCLLNGRWHCDKRETRVLTFKKPDCYLTSEKTDYYVRVDDELEAEVAKQILSFVRELSLIHI